MLPEVKHFPYNDSPWMHHKSLQISKAAHCPHPQLLLLLLAHLFPLIDDSSPQNPWVLLQVGKVGGGGGAGHQGGTTVAPGTIHGAQRLAVCLQKPVTKTRSEDSTKDTPKVWCTLHLVRNIMTRLFLSFNYIFTLAINKKGGVLLNRPYAVDT